MFWRKIKKPMRIGRPISIMLSLDGVDFKSNQDLLGTNPQVISFTTKLGPKLEGQKISFHL
jgi:hypothetical protein